MKGYLIAAIVVILLDIIAYLTTGEPNYVDAIGKLWRKRKGELGSILVDPTNWRTCLETYHKNGETRYYKNGWQVTKGEYCEEMKNIFRRISAQHVTQS